MHTLCITQSTYHSDTRTEQHGSSPPHQRGARRDQKEPRQRGGDLPPRSVARSQAGHEAELPESGRAETDRKRQRQNPRDRPSCQRGDGTGCQNQRISSQWAPHKLTP